MRFYPPTHACWVAFTGSILSHEWPRLWKKTKIFCREVKHNFTSPANGSPITTTCEGCGTKGKGWLCCIAAHQRAPTSLFLSPAAVTFQMLMCSIDRGLFKSIQSVHSFLFPLSLLLPALFPLLLRFFSSPKQLTAPFICTIILTHSKKKTSHAFPLPDGLKDIKGDSQRVKWKWPINDWKDAQSQIIIGEMWMGCSIPCIGFLNIKEFE